MKKAPPSEQKAQAIRDLLSGMDGSKSGGQLLSQLVRLSTERVLQELLEEEQKEVIGRERYERCEGALSRNGYRERKVKTAEGVLEVALPQVRGGQTPYRSQIWANLSNRSEVLEAIVTEMWVRGLSVRDVEEALLEATGAFVMSDTSVSQVTERLYAQYEAFKAADLSEVDVAYVFVDALYEPLRRFGSKVAILCAWCICTDGRRMLLGMTTGNGESFETALEFLRDLVRRGLKTPLTATTDGAPGLCKAIEAMWPKAWRIRCWFHKMQNLQAKVPPSLWSDFKARLADVRDAPDHEEAQRRLDTLIARYEHELPEACRCLRDDQQASLAHLNVPRRHRQMVRTTNLLERSFEEERRRSKTIPHLWGERAIEKLAFSVLIRVSHKWQEHRLFSEFEQQQVNQLRHQRGLDMHEIEQPTHKPKRRSAGHVAA